MQLWTVPPARSAAISPVAQRRAQRAGSGLIGSIARADFDTRGLRELNLALPVAWWTVYRRFDDRPPVLHAQGSFDAPDIALDCWHRYRAGLYHHDGTMAQARAVQSPGGDAVLLAHHRADDLPRDLREQIYRRHRLSERLAVLAAEDGALLAINLYRHRDQPRFAAEDFDTVLELAPVLLATVRRHVELSVAPPAPSPIDRLRQRCPALSERELAVCERLLRGWTQEGIAADLGLSPATVKTYRNRAFARLGIHFRNQLFSLAMAAEPA